MTVAVVTSANSALPHSYDELQVALSVVIAVAASYAALDLAGRVTATRARVRWAWLTGGAVAMGIGIWAMHYVGMLAFRLPLPISYHWPTVLLSLSAGILCSAFALMFVSRPRMGIRYAFVGSVVMGSGIAALHYIGMAAMRLSAAMRFDLFIVTLSVALAIGFSLAALSLAFYFRDEAKGMVWRKVGSAGLMGSAISAMHYTGMAAASFVPSFPPTLTHSVSVSSVGTVAIGVVTLILMGLAILTSSVGRRFDAQHLEFALAETRGKLDQMTRVATVGAAHAAQEWQHRLDLAQRAGLRIGLWDWNLSSNIVVWSDETYRQFGLTPDTFSGQVEDAVSRIHPEDLPAVMENIEKVLAGDLEYATQYRAVRPNGTVCWIDARGVLVRNGQTHMIGISIDITDQKKAQQALQETRMELAHVSRMVTMGELTASIAHEINQPLTAIVANGSASLRWLAMQPPNLDEAREAMSRVVRDANRAGAVIGRVRGLIRKAPTEVEPLDANKKIRQVLALAASEILKDGVTVRTELADDLPAVLGDHVQVEQVMLNLIINGIDAMSTIAGPRQLHIRSAKHPQGVLIQVQDSGTGYDPAQADVIFEPFFTTKRQGIGMGLSISRSIVEAHGGRLWATPGSPHGAIFQFTLPLAQSSDERVA